MCTFPSSKCRPKVLWIVFCMLPACGPREEPSVEMQSLAVSNGTALVPGTQAYDTAVITGYTYGGQVVWPYCTGTLLTNYWVLSAQHCQSPDANNMFVTHYPTTACTTDAQCSRSQKCITEVGSCGARIPNGAIVNNPKAYAPEGNDQVQLWKLEEPIKSGLNPTNYSIAQHIWYGDKNSLLQNRTISIVGGGPMIIPTLTTGTFQISSTPTIFAYTVTSGTYDLVGGDSGGPGYLSENGFTYLTGMTVQVTPTDSQHDYSEEWPGGSMYGWIDDTVFGPPVPQRYNVAGMGMVVTPTGAMQAFLQGNTYYFSQCDTEPCDHRGTWSTPGAFLQGGSYFSPGIALDKLNGTLGAQVFVPDYGGQPVYAYKNIKGAYLGRDNLGGACSGPVAADSRPNSGESPTLDIACRGSDGNLWIKQRQYGTWSGWYTLGAPSGGIRSGTAPAVTSWDSNVTLVSVVGTNGQVYYQVGIGGQGWLPSWVSLGGSNLRSVATASYSPQRMDVFAIDSSGRMQHRIWAGNWNHAWTQVTNGIWTTNVTPFAASYSGKLGLMNIGGIAPGASFIQRYNDW